MSVQVLVADDEALRAGLESRLRFTRRRGAAIP